MEAEGVRTKLRPKVSMSVSIGDSWWEERFLVALIFEASLQLLENPTLVTSEVFFCVCSQEEF